MPDSILGGSLTWLGDGSALVFDAIEKYGGRVADHDVGRLQVAMGDTPLMCRADRVGQLNGEVQQILERHAPSRG